MNNTIKAILLTLGDPQPEGGYIYPLSDDIKVPVLLSKDIKSSYPEIRVTPFIHNRLYHDQRYYEHTLRNRMDYKVGVFQIDIYSKTIIEVNNIYDGLSTRIFEYGHPEIVLYGYNQYFELLSERYYKNISYGIGDLFKDIYYIKIHDTYLTRVSSIDKITDNTFYVDTNALYIKLDTELNPYLEDIQIATIVQGLLFDDYEALSDKGVIVSYVGESTNLNKLESNDVYRISFDIEFLYTQKRVRDKFSNVDKISSKVEI